MQLTYIELAINKMLVELEDRLIQIKELEVISNKREREIDKDKDEKMACKQHTMAVIKIIN